MAATLACLVSAAGLASPVRAACPDLLEPRRVPPEELATFLDDLRRAVEERDAAAVAEHFAYDARFDFGDQLRIDSLDLEDRSSPAWPRLDKALAPGCVAVPSGGAHATWECPGLAGPETMRPSAEMGDVPDRDKVYILGLGDEVAVRAWPSEDAPSVASLSCGIAALDRAGLLALERASDGAWDAQDWVPVRLDGERGFVEGSAAYTPFGFRLLLEERGRGWKITAFIAGD